ncbi:MAG: hypothetical protein IKT31_10630 [Firmicutes bacterium]|nr:hypothetical protein [Bacillota bacterium]
MYNFMFAFVICAIVYIIGEYVSNATKAWIPSVFVTAVILLIGYWTVIPTTLVSDSNLIPFGSTIGIYLLITHMGTVISLKQLMQQWKTIVVCLAGLAGMIALCWFIGPLVMDKTLVIAGLPPLTGGIVAAPVMKDAAAAAGLEVAAVFAIAMYCVQGFAGYPLTAVCLQIEGKRLLKDLRAGKVTITPEMRKEMASVGIGKVSDDPTRKTLLKPLPEKWNSPVVQLGKLGLVAWLATQFGAITGISGAIWALVFGVIATTIGFLETTLLNRANSYQITMFALMMYVFDGLKDCTPEMLGKIIVPMLVLIVIGVVGMAIAAFIIAKVLKMSFPMALANGLTALYGFPPDAIITDSTCKALGKTEEEYQYLMLNMFPSMIVGGFTTVTITSVFVAGIFAGLL